MLTQSGTSVNVLIHFLQLVIAGGFRKYDFGPVVNIEKYGQLLPPDYELEKVTAPVYIYYSGEGDLVTSRLDVWETLKELPNVRYVKYINDNQWSHLDFLIAKNVKEVINSDVIKFMKNGV